MPEPVGAEQRLRLREPLAPAQPEVGVERLDLAAVALHRHPQGAALLGLSPTTAWARWTKARLRVSRKFGHDLTE